MPLPAITSNIDWAFPGDSAPFPETRMAISAKADGSERKFLALSLLTEQSRRLETAHWEVAIYHPKLIHREYTYQGKQRISHGFQCMLVSTADPTQYVLGDSHGKGITEQKAKEMEKTFKEGLVFQMTKVAFATNLSQQYNNTPKTEVVSMQNTTWISVLSSANKPTKPEPGIPIAASIDMGREQLFDALALVAEVGPVGNGGMSGGQARVRVQVKLTDGSTNETSGNVVHMPVTIFTDARSDGTEPQTVALLRSAASAQTALAFFGIQGKQSASEPGKYAFTSSFGFFFDSASDTQKGKELEKEATTLINMSSEELPMAAFGRASDQNESFEEISAHETNCALFKTMMAPTKIQAIEGETTFWQINWCQVHLPEKGESISTNDSSRLWMPVRVEDDTGNITLYMREKAALALAGHETKESFESAVADDELYFPNKASIKIIRKPATPQTPAQTRNSDDKPESSADQPAQIQYYIVEAGQQPLEDTHSKKSDTLLKLLEETPANADACVACPISAIRQDPHYGLCVHFDVEGELVKKKCKRALTLVRATKASETEKIGADFMMITKDVEDPLEPTKQFSCTMVAFCALKAAADYQLKPLRGQTKQTAAVVISSVLEAGSAGKPPKYLVDSIEKMDPTEAEHAAEHMNKRIRFAGLIAKMQGTGSKRELAMPWTDEKSPANASKCRKLGRAPTGSPTK